MHLAGTIMEANVSGTARECIGPSVRKERGPQDDKLRGDLPISERFPLFIILIRLFFASIYMYNPARSISF
jgi:hypothetical protein